MGLIDRLLAFENAHDALALPGTNTSGEAMSAIAGSGGTPVSGSWA